MGDTSWLAFTADPGSPKFQKQLSLPTPPLDRSVNVTGNGAGPEFALTSKLATSSPGAPTSTRSFCVSTTCPPGPVSVSVTV